MAASGNSKPGQYRSERQAALNRHGLQRIREFCATVTARLVGFTLQREHTAQVRVVAPEQEIDDR